MPHTFYDWSSRSKPPLLQPHSVAKHEVLEAYLERYIEMLTADPRRDNLRLTIVDGFAGGGVYRHAETGELCTGSPLIFLETIQRMEATAKTKRTKEFCIDATYYFIDNDASALAFLKSELRRRGYGKLVGERIFLLHGTFTALFPGMMEMIRARKGRVLFLLDQCGYKDAPLPLIRKIFKQLNNAEVFLTFSVDALVNYMADTDEFRKCVSNVDPTGKLLSERDIREVEKLKKKEGASGRSAKWRLMIEKKLLHRLTRMCGARHYTPYFITSSKSYRAYWFLHLSMHVKAWDEMLKLHWKHHNCFMHHGGAGLDMFGFNPRNDGEASKISDFRFDDVAKEQSTEALMNQLPRIIHRAKDGLMFNDLLVRQSNHTPAHSGIFKQVMRDLQKEGEIEIIDHRTGKQRRTIGHWNNHIWSRRRGIYTPQNLDR